MKRRGRKAPRGKTLIGNTIHSALAELGEALFAYPIARMGKASDEVMIARSIMSPPATQCWTL